MREQILADRAKPIDERRATYVFRICGGKGGVRAGSGEPLATGMQLPFVLDPAAADNIVAWRAFQAR